MFGFRLFIVVVCMSIGYSLHGQGFDYAENSLYILNFIKYTEWPGKKTQVSVGVLGNSPVTDELHKLFSYRRSSNISYTVRRISLADVKQVDVVILAVNAAHQMRALNTVTEYSPVLIISEKENMCRFGACISFFIDEDNDFKTSYQLSLRNCSQRGLKVGIEIKNNAVLTR
jgi:hypothetical protein